MNFIATVNTPAHGHISVTFSDNEKSVLGAWRDNVTIELSGKEKQQITNDIICNRRHKRVFEKAYVSTSGFGVFIFPVRSGRFCQSKLIEFATQIALWVKTESGFDFSEQEAVGEGMRIANNAIKCKNVTYEAGIDSWSVSCGDYERGVRKEPYSHPDWQVRGEGLETPLSFRPPAAAGNFRNGQRAFRGTEGKRPGNFRETAGFAFM